MTMNEKLSKRNKGFTIIELMIVLVILAILLAIAYPSYVQYVRKANRGDAQQLLLNWAVNQEIWRSNHTEYADENDIAVPTNDKYTFAVVADATTYLLSATAQGDQAKDKARNGESCTNLYLNQAGVKYNDATDTTKSACWE